MALTNLHYVDNSDSTYDTLYSLFYGYIVKINSYNYKYSVKFSGEDNKVNSLFPNSKISKYEKLLKEYSNKLGDKINYYFNTVNKYSYLGKESDTDNILTYVFSSSSDGLKLYETINLFNLLNKNDKVFVIANNGFLLDILVYYEKYVLNSMIMDNIYALLQYYEPTKDDQFTQNLISKHKIKNIIHNDSPLNNSTINSVLNSKIVKDSMFNLVIINYITNTANLNYNFQSIFSSVVLSVQKLKMDGSIIIFLPLITSKEHFDWFNSVGNHFRESYIYNSEVVHMYDHFTVFVCKNYQSSIDVNTLLEINKKYYECEPFGGKMYKYSKCYLNTIVVPNKDNTNYLNYCRTISNSYDEMIQNLQRILYIHNNPVNIDKIKNDNMMYSIGYAKKIGLDTVEWVNAKNTNKLFFEKTFRQIVNILSSYTELFKHRCSNFVIKEYDTVKYHDKTHLNNMYMMSEHSFMYTENVNFKPVELMFNSIQKHLQKHLLNKFNISINGNAVSRAWVKLREIYIDTNYFSNLLQNSRKINVLHICEAPGNFVASSLHYAKTNNFEYNWTAQSLKDGDIFDSYGFIKNNSSKWDFAEDGTGDIMTNIKYYYDKYKGVDSLIGDCGVAWSGENDPTKNLAVYQLLYALLIPRIGGNFIVKTYATNFDMQYLSLLYTICAKYEKMYVFRSSRNFWSPEIYIVGVGRKKIDDAEIEALLNIGTQLTKGVVMYPTNFVSADFSLEYEFYMQNIIEMYTQVKKFIVYLARNPDILNKTKQKLIDAFERKNKIWIEKYLQK